MTRSIALALHLFQARRDAGPPIERTAPRPEGQLIWLHAGEGATLKSLGQLAERLAAAPGTPRILLTVEGKAAPDAGVMPPGTVSDVLPPDRLPPVRAFLDHWRPDIALFAGASLPPAMIVECHDRAIPLILADVKMTAQMAARWRWRQGMAASLLSRFEHVLTQDPDTLMRLLRLGGRDLDASVGGRIEETTDPLACNEAELAALAGLVQVRPVWLAVNCPKAEEDAVIAAHAHAMRQAHRMLLILVPNDPAQAAALADRMTREGWLVGLRSRDEEPDPEVQLYIADVEGELGLWYRLAPVTYMGGTLLQDGTGRNPYEPAALGSAILHGPRTNPYPEAYARLTAAKAVAAIGGPEALPHAVADLTAP
ncbi:MAG: 3-deoxy-D-manno-octulosonic acid transferase, partial [Rhodobacteraceae bacterium]|nr:3-deoxy-D-manno-octulosonic acid transferase [Paracoccaceae bacterium]